MLDYRPAGRGPFAVELAELKPTDVVLNVGCYNGHLERFFIEKRAAACFGVDANREAIDFAQSQGGKGHFQFSYAEKLPFPDAMFDKVLCLDTLEHVNSEAQALREIHRVLKPGGSLVLSVPHDFLNFLDPDELTRDARNLVRTYIRKKERLDHPRHRHYSEAQLRELLSSFRIDVVHKCGTPVFWGLAMFYTAFGLPERLTARFRRFTNPIEDAEYRLKLPTGFNIMVKATKPI